MIQKTTLSMFRFILFFSILFFTKTTFYAQTIVPQQLGYPRICAGLIIDGKPFNEYNATFSYVDFPAGTTFEVELSDSAGNFTTPTATQQISVTNPTATQQTIRFSVPTDLKGSDTYSMRIKSNTTTPVYSLRYRNSLAVTSFPIYYRTYVETFFINDKLGEATFCTGGSLSLALYNPTPNVPASSPANYPNLKYKWFKDDVAVAGQSGTTLLVNTPGVYYAQIDYGGCNDENFSSNRVTVSSSASGSAVTVQSSLGNPFCSSGEGTVLSAVTTGTKFLWKKDGVAVANGTTRSITTNEPGLYTVDVDFGGCKSSGSIDLKNNSFNASIDVADEFHLNEGETVSATVTTDAPSPTVEWFFNGNLVSAAKTESYTIAVRGSYKVIISQTSGCVAKKEFSFKVTGESGPSTVIPNIIKLGGSNPYWNIPNEYKNTSTKVMIVSSNGDLVLDVVDYQGDWPQTIDFKNVNPVYYYVIQSDTGEKKGSITVIK
jgi:hypothetical protein